MSAKETIERWAANERAQAERVAQLEAALRHEKARADGKLFDPCGARCPDVDALLSGPS